jgi:hypothetical protein
VAPCELLLAVLARRQALQPNHITK